MNKLIDNDAYIPFAMAHAYAVKDGYKGTIQDYAKLRYEQDCRIDVAFDIEPPTFKDWLKTYR